MPYLRKRSYRRRRPRKTKRKSRKTCKVLDKRLRNLEKETLSLKWKEYVTAAPPAWNIANTPISFALDQFVAPGTGLANSGQFEGTEIRQLYWYGAFTLSIGSGTTDVDVRMVIVRANQLHGTGIPPFDGGVVTGPGTAWNLYKGPNIDEGHQAVGKWHIVYDRMFHLGPADTPNRQRNITTRIKYNFPKSYQRHVWDNYAGEFTKNCYFLYFLSNQNPAASNPTINGEGVFRYVYLDA